MLEITRIFIYIFIIFISISKSNGSSISELFRTSLYSAIGVSNITGSIGQTEFDNLLKKLSLESNTTSNDTTSLRKCLSTKEYFTINNLNASFGVLPADFNALCPVILQQLITKTCQSNITVITNEQGILGTPAQVWGYGMASVIIISLLALNGAVLVPCMSSVAYRYVLSYLVSLGIGTLVGDAMLHLIPYVLGMELHGSFTVPFGYLCGVLIAIYILFLIDTIGHRVFQSESEDDQTVSHGHSHTMDVKAYDSQTKTLESSLEMSSSDNVNFDNSQQKLAKKKKTDHRLGFMLVFGDSLHNFADGMAIGAAFQTSISAGLSTSVAILCHELPHELGDFAILLSAGYSYKKALLLNLVSGILACLGLCIGIPLSTLPFMREIVLCLTAGMFLYLGLYKMMECLFLIKAKNGIFQCFLDSLGIFCGYGIMIAIAYYEDLITF